MTAADGKGDKGGPAGGHEGGGGRGGNLGKDRSGGMGGAGKSSRGGASAPDTTGRSDTSGPNASLGKDEAREKDWFGRTFGLTTNNLLGMGTMGLVGYNNQTPVGPTVNNLSKVGEVTLDPGAFAGNLLGRMALGPLGAFAGQQLGASLGAKFGTGFGFGSSSPAQEAQRPSPGTSAGPTGGGYQAASPGASSLDGRNWGGTYNALARLGGMSPGQGDNWLDTWRSRYSTL